MRRVIHLVMVFCLCIASVPFLTVHAEDHPYSDESYWGTYCTSSGADVSACQGYVDYLSSKSDEAQKRLSEIESKRDDIAANLAEYDSKLKDLEKQIDAQQTKIDEQQAKINEKQSEIDAKQVQIEETQKQVTALEDKVKKRMVTSQPTMHFNKYLDILMGASSFQDLLRIASGLVSITKYDDKTLSDLETMREKLSTEKKELETAKQELEEGKQKLVDAQNEMVVQKAEQQVIIEEAQKKYAELQAEGNRISSNIDSIQDTMQKMKDAGTLDTVISASGWTYPVPGSYISAGTWAYPGGSLHLGADFAASVGTPVLAVGNGVVMNSANGCPTYGGLGSTCGNNIGGAAGGGNQLQALVAINGSLYAINYNHMMLGSPIPTGTVITSGMQIGLVGSSGNSTGPHCHIEIYYLGDASNFSNYAATWNGDVSFGTNWYYAARKCDDGVGAPCRLRPETVFGG